MASELVDRGKAMADAIEDRFGGIAVTIDGATTTVRGWVDEAANALSSQEAEIGAWAEIAEHYRSAMLMAEAAINSLPMPVADGQTSAVWKRVSDASDILHAARQDMIHKHGTTFLNSCPIGPGRLKDEG